MTTKLKITVLRREFYEDLVAEYAAQPTYSRCGRYEDGQEFIVDPYTMPEGFCPWAWADIHREIIAMSHDAVYPWFKENAIIACCTDGLRPVVFKIEKINE